MSKWWQNFHCWVNYPLKGYSSPKNHSKPVRPLFIFGLQKAFWPCIDSNGTTTFKTQKGSNDNVKIVHVTSVVQRFFCGACQWCCWHRSQRSDVEPGCAAVCLQAEECTCMSWTRVKVWLGREDIVEKSSISLFIVVIFVFLAHKKFSRSIKLQLNHWCHMNNFNNVLTTFLGLEHGSCVAVYAGSESSQISSKNILICVPKINEGLTGLERHEGE